MVRLASLDSSMPTLSRDAVIHPQFLYHRNSEWQAKPIPDCRGQNFDRLTAQPCIFPSPVRRSILETRTDVSFQGFLLLFQVKRSLKAMSILAFFLYSSAASNIKMKQLRQSPTVLCLAPDLCRTICLYGNKPVVGCSCNHSSPLVTYIWQAYKKLGTNRKEHNCRIRQRGFTCSLLPWRHKGSAWKLQTHNSCIIFQFKCFGATRK